MSLELTNLTEEELQVVREDLIAQAKTLNISYHPNISTDKLAERIKQAKAGTLENEPSEQKDKVAADIMEKFTYVAPDEIEPSKEEILNQRYVDAHKLVRVLVTCHDPLKSTWEGEILETGNQHIGTIRKFVPFGKETHIPNGLLKLVEEKEYQQFYDVKTDKGGTVTRARQAKAYSVSRLDNLTKEQLDKLARDQAARGGLE